MKKFLILCFLLHTITCSGMNSFFKKLPIISKRFYSTDRVWFQKYLKDLMQLDGKKFTQEIMKFDKKTWQASTHEDHKEFMQRVLRYLECYDKKTLRKMVPYLSKSCGGKAVRLKLKDCHRSTIAPRKDGASCLEDCVIGSLEGITSALKWQQYMMIWFWDELFK